MEYKEKSQSYRPQSITDIVARYGTISVQPSGDLVWTDADLWLKACVMPKEISAVLKMANGKPVTRIFCNSDAHSPLLDALGNLIYTGTHKELYSFDGCFNVRWVRGHPGQVSMHSYALALDFNAFRNPLGALKGSWSDIFVKCWTDVGWTYGGDFTRHDPMHFQWCG